jgi:GTP cyclohydrolase II
MKSFSARPLEVSRYAEADVPTEYGRMRVAVYHETGTTHEHCAITYGDVRGKEQVLTRVHSECFTGEVLHSLKCECREQLDYAMRAIAEAGAGIIIYLRQEGRGIGLGNKIRAYALQEEKGADTVDANRMLGFADDLRRYHVATSILHEYDIRSVRLMTNNPDKVNALREAGLEVERVPVQIDAHQHNEGYLAAKKVRMGHLF